jgi:hypothetical protein
VRESRIFGVPDFRPVRAIGVTATVLVWLTTLSLIPLAVTTCGLIDAINQPIGPQWAKHDHVVAAAAALGRSVLVVVALALAAAVAYWIWSWRARLNAEAMAGRKSQELSRGWTVWGWLCPVVNVWLPCQVLLDIYRASSTREQRTTRMVLLWWAFTLAAGFVPEISVMIANWDAIATALLMPDVKIAVITSFVLLSVSAAFLSVVIRRVNQFQSQHRMTVESFVADALITT